MARAIMGRRVRSVVLALLLVSNPSLAACAPLRSAGTSLDSMPLYESVDDPVGKPATRILAVGNVLSFGWPENSRESLQRSDIGFVLYFVRVDGGVRVRDNPIVFPDDSHDAFQFEDYSCGVSRLGQTKTVECKSENSGEVYRSVIVDGGLVSFDIRCLEETPRVCHYKLIDGNAIRPNNIDND